MAGKTKAAAKPAKPKKARPAQDKAGRPSPPDRDGDGKSGGSLKGNKTAISAKGTDEAVLARREIAKDGLATVVLKGVSIGRKAVQPIGVNGNIRKLKIGVEVQVNAAELEALIASHVEFDTVSEGAAAAVVEGSSAAAETPATEPDQPKTAEGTTEGGAPDPAIDAGAATQTQEGTEDATGNGGDDGAEA